MRSLLWDIRMKNTRAAIDRKEKSGHAVFLRLDLTDEKKFRAVRFRVRRSHAISNIGLKSNLTFADDRNKNDRSRR